MNVLFDLKKYTKKRFLVKPEDLIDLTEREMLIWKSDSLHDDKLLLSPKVESRMMQKIPLIAIKTGIRSSTGLLKEYNRIILQVALIKILVNFSAVRLYTYMAERLIGDCRKYAMVSEGYFLSRLLHYVFSAVETNNDKRLKYAKLRDLFEKEYQIEQKAERYYSDIANFRKKKKYHHDQATELARHFDTELKDLVSKIDNPKYIVLKYLIRLNIFEINGDTHSYLQTCNEALDIFGKIPLKGLEGEQLFITKKLKALSDLKRYDELENFTLDMEKRFKKNSLVWIQFLERKLLAYLRQLKIDLATVTLKQIESSSYKTKAHRELKDRLYLYRLYVNFLGKNFNKIEVNQVALDLPRFALDLKGMNVSLIIAELAHAAMLHDFDHIESRQDAITNYIDNHVHKNVRSKWFIRILMNIALSQHEWHKWLRLHNRMFGRMNNSQDVVENIELAEFSLLWKIICQRAFKKNKRYKTYVDQSHPNHYWIAGLD